MVINIMRLVGHIGPINQSLPYRHINNNNDNNDDDNDDGDDDYDDNDDNNNDK